MGELVQILVALTLPVGFFCGTEKPAPDQDFDQLGPPCLALLLLLSFGTSSNVQLHQKCFFLRVERENTLVRLFSSHAFLFLRVTLESQGVVPAQVKKPRHTAKVQIIQQA